MKVPKYGMAIDLQKCVGASACVEACKVENNTGEGIFWMRVFRFEEGKYPDAQVRFLPRPCQHCDNPPCVKVCPTQARFKRSDGFVLSDFKRCIGCRYCIVACPYGVNYFNWRDPEDNQYLDWDDNKEVKSVTNGSIPPWKNPDLDKRYGPDERLVAGSGHFKGVVEKCTFCVHRLDKGELPACVTTCPTHAIAFGDLEDPESPVSEVLKAKRGFRLKENLGTNPKVHYVGDVPPSTDGREVEPVQAEVRE